MMENIRSAANSIAVKIIFAIIILCFIFTGVGFLGFGGKNSARDEQMYIAKIDGEGISRAGFENQVRRETSNQDPSNLDPVFIQQLRKEILTYQINNYLIGKFANDLNVKGSNQQIKEAIRNDAVFFENGKFSNKKYLELLTQNGYTPDSYAEILRSSLQKQQVIKALTSSLFVLPVDSELALLKDQTRVVYAAPINTSILKIDPVSVSKEDEQKYYAEHPNEFKKKERVKFKFIGNFKHDVESNVTVSDSELKQEYKKNILTYQSSGKKSYSIIYLSDKNRADEIANQISSENFDQIAQTTNSDNQVSPYGKNGALGWFADDDTLPQPFKDAALNTIGQISKPIKLEDGYLIIRLDDIQKVITKDFDSVKSQIKTVLTEQKINKILEKREAALQTELAKDSESLEEIAKQAGLSVVESDWTDYGDETSILRYPEIRDVAFGPTMLINNKAIGKISEIIPIGNQQDESIIIQVIDYRPEGTAPFDEVQAEISQKLYAKLTNERLQSAATSIMDELNNKGKSDKISLTKSYSLTRNSTELNHKVVDMIFNLVPPNDNKPVFGMQFVDNTNGYIVMLEKVIPAAQKHDISGELLPNMQNDLQYYLSLGLNSKAKVEIMPNANL